MLWTFSDLGCLSSSTPIWYPLDFSIISSVNTHSIELCQNQPPLGSYYEFKNSALRPQTHCLGSCGHSKLIKCGILILNTFYNKFLYYSQPPPHQIPSFQLPLDTAHSKTGTYSKGLGNWGTQVGRSTWVSIFPFIPILLFCFILPKYCAMLCVYATVSPFN